jgi:hypothetical protein
LEAIEIGAVEEAKADNVLNERENGKKIRWNGFIAQKSYKREIRLKEISNTWNFHD